MVTDVGEAKVRPVSSLQSMDRQTDQHEFYALAILRCQSIKCTECGKILKSAAFASFHAEKSGHTSFEESTEEASFINPVQDSRLFLTFAFDCRSSRLRKKRRRPSSRSVSFDSLPDCCCCCHIQR